MLDVLEDPVDKKWTLTQAAILENEGMLDVLEDPDDKKFGNASSVSSDNDSRANIARWAFFFFFFFITLGLELSDTNVYEP